MQEHGPALGDVGVVGVNEDGVGEVVVAGVLVGDAPETEEEGSAHTPVYVPGDRWRTGAAEGQDKSLAETCPSVQASLT